MVWPVSTKMDLGINCPILNVYDVVPRARKINTYIQLSSIGTANDDIIIGNYITFT